MGLVKRMSDTAAALFGRLIEPSRVLAANAKTKASFKGRIVGYFKRMGPNSWDPFEYILEDGGEIDVFPGVRVQVEAQETRFRMRVRGKVHMIAWAPSEADRTELGGGDLHALFVERCIERFNNKGGIGVSAFIAKSLRS